METGGIAVLLFIAAQIVAGIYWAIRQHTTTSVVRERMKKIEADIIRNAEEIERLLKSKHDNANHIMRLQSQMIQVKEAVEALAKRGA